MFVARRMPYMTKYDQLPSKLEFIFYESHWLDSTYFVSLKIQDSSAIEIQNHEKEPLWRLIAANNIQLRVAYFEFEKN